MSSPVLSLPGLKIETEFLRISVFCLGSDVESLKEKSIFLCAWPLGEI